MISAPASPFGIILNWFRDSVKWVIYELERGSGQIQNVFSKMNPLAQFLFVIGYGIAQPSSSAGLSRTDHAYVAYHRRSRAMGWYAVLPLLLYIPFAAWRSRDGSERRTWIWLAAFTWTWILICAIRAGGDQWDNPRYRLIFFGIESLVAGYAWLSWRERHDAWLPRIIGLEILCVLMFGQWYLARYYLDRHPLTDHGSADPKPVTGGLILVGGWLWDGMRARRRSGFRPGAESIIPRFEILLRRMSCPPH